MNLEKIKHTILLQHRINLILSRYKISDSDKLWLIEFHNQQVQLCLNSDRLPRTINNYCEPDHREKVSLPYIMGALTRKCKRIRNSKQLHTYLKLFSDHNDQVAILIGR
jgi:hypothetical protein